MDKKEIEQKWAEIEKQLNESTKELYGKKGWKVDSDPLHKGAKVETGKEGAQGAADDFDAVSLERLHPYVAQDVLDEDLSAGLQRIGLLEIVGKHGPQAEGKRQTEKNPSRHGDDPLLVLRCILNLFTG